MQQAINENQQLEITSTEHLQLPCSIVQLLNIYENEEALFIRVCVLSKIKQIIMREVHFQATKILTPCPEEVQQAHAEALSRIERQIFNEDPMITNTIFSAFFLKFLRKSSRKSTKPKNQIKLLYHVVCIVIKYFYNEEHFKFLINQITDLIENQQERIQTALEFFIEVIQTIQYNYQQSFFKEKENAFGAKINHCKFERYFSTSHLNSMLMIANFFMQRAILRDNESIEIGIFNENFKLKATQEHICSILELLHKVLCFDFIGEKYSQNENDGEVTNIIIPTKNTKHTNLSQFEKWLKNSDWIRIYQFIYQSCKMVKIKTTIIEILGDMSRIHMKYFKNKACFKVHIENIVYALADILQQTMTNHSKEQILKISITFGRSLVKLTSTAIIPIFFQINSNLSAGLLQSVKTFLIDQIINEDVFNVNIVLFFFKFLFNLHRRCRYERTPGPFELIERITRQISRSYQNYLRILLRKLFKSTKLLKGWEHFYVRQDYMHMRQIFQSYNNQEITIVLSPFQFMKPRYTSINSIEELFVIVCAKVTRSLYILETFVQNTRQREFALQMIEKSILQTIEWFTFTTYFKSRTRESSEDGKAKPIYNFSKKIADNIELTMESINQEYEEEIQNQYQYCHMLRVICFFILECLEKIPERIYKHMNSNNQIFKLINLCIEICFQADLQEEQNKSKFTITVKSIIESRLQASWHILERLFLKQWEYHLFLMNREDQSARFSYRFKVLENEYQFTQIADVKDRIHLINQIQKAKSPFSTHNENVNRSLKCMEILLAYSVSKEDNSSIQNYSSITSLEDCQCFLLLIFENPALMNLLQFSEPTIKLHYQTVLNFIRQYQIQSVETPQINQYLQILSFIIKIRQEQVQEEMTNRLFLVLYRIAQILQLADQMGKIDPQLVFCLKKIDEEHLAFKNQMQFQQLHQKIQTIYVQFNKQVVQKAQSV